MMIIQIPINVNNLKITMEHISLAQDFIRRIEKKPERYSTQEINTFDESVEWGERAFETLAAVAGKILHSSSRMQDRPARWIVPGGLWGRSALRN
jgi:hypothetical protein